MQMNALLPKHRWSHVTNRLCTYWTKSNKHIFISSMGSASAPLYFYTSQQISVIQTAHSHVDCWEMFSSACFVKSCLSRLTGQETLPQRSPMNVGSYQTRSLAGPCENWYGSSRISTIYQDIRCCPQNIGELSCWTQYKIKFCQKKQMENKCCSKPTAGVVAELFTLRYDCCFEHCASRMLWF